MCMCMCVCVCVCMCVCVCVCVCVCNYRTGHTIPLAVSVKLAWTCIVCVHVRHAAGSLPLEDIYDGHFIINTTLPTIGTLS
jgi:hypothetical protein